MRSRWRSTYSLLHRRDNPDDAQRENNHRVTISIARCTEGASSCRVRLLLLLLGGPFVVYLYVWRNYLVLFVQPSSHEFNFNSQLDFQRQSLKKSHDQLRQQIPWTHNLPAWFSDYWDWHVRMRSNDTLLQSNTTKFLIVSIRSNTAGGLADRMRSLPVFLWEAAQTNRVFLMEWARPCALEELLWPPAGGIDWTLPSFMTKAKAKVTTNNFRSDDQETWYNFESTKSMIYQHPSTYERVRVVLTQPNHASFVIGMPYLEQSMNISSTDTFWKHFYQLLVTPSPPVQELLDKTLQTTGLLSPTSSRSSAHHDNNDSYNYWAIHLRARYPGSSDAFQSRSFFSRSVDADGFQMTVDAKSELTRLFRNALTCLDNYVGNFSKVLNHTQRKVYFASDTNEAVQYVIQSSTNDKRGSSSSTHVVGMVTPYERFHLNRNDRMGGLRTTPPMAFYPAVVDLWILKQARCIAVGKGGYGLLAARLGGISCFVLHEPNDFAPLGKAC